MISDTITEIENWYREPGVSNDRSLLLSKLAIIEFCGWLEEWMDDVIREIDKLGLKDASWTKKELIESTYGFHYDKHFRPMLCGLFGEHKLRKIESDFEEANPGELSHLKSNLGSLWVERCKLAHSDLSTQKAAQVTINAPSWTKNQYRVMIKRLELFKNFLVSSI